MPKMKSVWKLNASFENIHGFSAGAVFKKWFDVLI
jgi:hypothetical protein